jgi:hypothetical protein
MSRRSYRSRAFEPGGHRGVTSKITAWPFNSPATRSAASANVVDDHLGALGVASGDSQTEARAPTGDQRDLAL